MLLSSDEMRVPPVNGVMVVSGFSPENDQFPIV
jgi:hypothetical protein